MTVQNSELWFNDLSWSNPWLVAIALNTKIFGLQSQDLNLVTAVIVGLALILPQVLAQVRWRRKVG